MNETIATTLQKHLSGAFDVARYLYDNPELGYEEFKACDKLSQSFRDLGFGVETGICGLPTAFRADFDSGRPGPRIALCAEYDALPGIGHGCGHNLICTMALLAAAGLKSVLPETGGVVTVFGTPAEETSGAKVAMAEEGLFDSMDIVMMSHPAPISEESGTSLCLVPLQFRYHGKAAHAAACPQNGVNALDAVIQLFNGINAIRQHVQKDVLFHGYISNGGAAPNIVPDLAEARFYIRAQRRATAMEAAEKVKKIAEGAALMTGATLEISSFEASYFDLVTNHVLRDVFTRNQAALPGDQVQSAQAGIGSLDLGNVSYHAPCVHGWIGFGDPSLVVHSREFADLTVTESGRELLYRGAAAMAQTGYDVLTDPALLARIRTEFEASR